MQLQFFLENCLSVLCKFYITTSTGIEILHQFIGLDTVLFMFKDECSFNRMKRGELFDYLTEKVTLSEKETRSAPLNNPIVDSPNCIYTV